MSGVLLRDEEGRQATSLRGRQGKGLALATERDPVRGPGRGRPRSLATQQKILAATAALLAEGGLPAVTMEAVAARAGVAKTTLYRWWPNRAAVALDCVSARMTPITGSGRTGDHRKRFQRQLKTTIRLLKGAEGRAILALIGAKQTDPLLAGAYAVQIARPRRVHTRRMAQQAIADGELDAATDPDLFLDAIYGPLYYRQVVSGDPVTDDFIDAIVEAAFRAFSPPRAVRASPARPASRSLPGRRPCRGVPPGR